MAAVDFNGKWKETRSENREVVLEAVGIPAEMRKKFLEEKHVLDITHDKDSFHIKTLTDDGKVVMENSGKIGVAFMPKLPEGTPPMGEVVLTWEDDGKVLRTKSTQSDKMPVTDMKMDNEELVIEQKIGDACAYSYHTKM